MDKRVKSIAELEEKSIADETIERNPSSYDEFDTQDDYDTPDGTGVRDYIHVVDLAKGHLKAMEYAQKHTGAETFNLGTGNGYSVLDVVKAYEKVTGKHIPYQIVARRPGDVDKCYADSSKANNILGWKAEYNIEDMCRDADRWQSMNPMGYGD